MADNFVEAAGVALPKPVNPLTGAEEANGASILDVIDPHHPQYLAHVPGEPGLYKGGGAQTVAGKARAPE